GVHRHPVAFDHPVLNGPAVTVEGDAGGDDGDPGGGLDAGTVWRANRGAVRAGGGGADRADVSGVGRTGTGLAAVRGLARRLGAARSFGQCRIVHRRLDGSGVRTRVRARAFVACRDRGDAAGRCRGDGGWGVRVGDGVDL